MAPLGTTVQLTQVHDGTLSLWPLPAGLCYTVSFSYWLPSFLPSVPHPYLLGSYSPIDSFLLDFYPKLHLKKQGKGNLLSSHTSWMSLSQSELSSL